MNKLWIIIVAVLLILAFLQCSNSSVEPGRNVARELTIAEKSLSGSGNLFGFKFFKEVARQEKDKNLFISPLSVSMALGMAYNGASGNTQEAIQKTLELSGLSLQEVNESYKSLTELLRGLDDKVIFQIGNSIWYRQGLNVEKGFIDLNQTYFNASVTPLDFNDPSAAPTINGWVDKSTNGKIKEIVDSPIDPSLVMFLINAIYFKGTWTYQFDKKATSDDFFTISDGSKKPCKMMFQKGDFQYSENPQFQSVDLPYGNGKFSMIVILPQKQIPVDSLIMQFDRENWEKWTAGFSPQKGELSFPRFTMSYDAELKSVLQALGMGIAFDPDQADFTRIRKEGELFISKVKHKTFVDVNEEGTEAAAVTSVEIGITSIGPSGFVMRVDRPFVFAIYERQSQSILFMGKIAQPTM